MPRPRTWPFRPCLRQVGRWQTWSEDATEFRRFILDCCATIKRRNRLFVVERGGVLSICCWTQITVGGRRTPGSFPTCRLIGRLAGRTGRAWLSVVGQVRLGGFDLAVVALAGDVDHGLCPGHDGAGCFWAYADGSGHGAASVTCQVCRAGSVGRVNRVAFRCRHGMMRRRPRGLTTPGAALVWFFGAAPSFVVSLGIESQAVLRPTR